LTDGYAYIQEPDGMVGFSPPPTITNILFAAAQLVWRSQAAQLASVA
jgi:hypothetical protein